MSFLFKTVQRAISLSSGIKTRFRTGITYQTQKFRDVSCNQICTRCALRSKKEPVRFLLASSVISGLLISLGLKEDPALEEDPLVLLVKKAIIKRGDSEFDEAENILHEALGLARTKENEKAITYIFTTMAQNAVDQYEFMKAIKLYKLVLSRILGADLVTEDDEAVIDISLQLAKCFSEERDYEKADSGFRFALGHQRKRISQIKLDDGHELTEAEKNSLAILGMGLDMWARHRVKKKEYGLALADLKEALAISKRVSGQTDPRTITLTNDVGVVADLHGNVDEALLFFKDAVKLATATDNMNLLVYYLNMGMALMRCGDPVAGKLACNFTLMSTVDTGGSSSGAVNRPLRVRAIKCMELCDKEEYRLKRLAQDQAKANVSAKQ
ncbi:Tetratricopeptide repeat protein 19, mitochondrial [Halotydeus destructor]|nr:Tetratricopeptide repeat protein 19, mitochondrial [Halotydeus destructor]